MWNNEPNIEFQTHHHETLILIDLILLAWADDAQR